MGRQTFHSFFDAPPDMSTFSQSSFLDACKRGDEAKIKRLLSSVDADADVEDEYARGPLHLALAHNHGHLVPLLLAAPNIDVNAANDDGSTPLHVAAAAAPPDPSSSFLAAVSQLLAFPGVRLEVTDDSGRSPFQIALERENRAFVDQLLAVHSERSPPPRSAIRATPETQPIHCENARWCGVDYVLGGNTVAKQNDFSTRAGDATDFSAFLLSPSHLVETLK